MRGDSASATARVIALATVMMGADARGRGEVAEGAGEWSRRLLACGSRVDRVMCALMRTGVGRVAARGLERATVPGILGHYQRRKRVVEGWCRGAIAEGFGQVVVLGAGLDTLGIRLMQEGRGVRCVEVDHPATQAMKRRCFGVVERAPVLVAADLSWDSVEGAMRAGGVDVGAPVFVVAEGLFMYFDEARVWGMLEGIRRCGRGEKRIAFSFMDRAVGAGEIGFRPTTRLVGMWLRGRGEAFRSAMDSRTVAAEMAGMGWRVREVRRFERPAGETLALAEWRGG